MRNGPRCGGQGRAGLRVGSGPRGGFDTCWLLRVAQGACVTPRRVSLGMPRWSVRKSQSSSPPAGHAGTTISPMATASSSSLRLGPARATAAAYLPSGRQGVMAQPRARAHGSRVGMYFRACASERAPSGVCLLRRSLKSGGGMDREAARVQGGRMRHREAAPVISRAL